MFLTELVLHSSVDLKRAVIVLVITTVLLYIVWTNSDILVQSLDLLLKTNPEIVLSALILTTFEFVLQAQRMALFFNKGLESILPAYAVGHFTAFVFPSRMLGEGARALSMAKVVSESAHKLVSFVSIERMFDVVLLLSLSSLLLLKYSPLALVLPVLAVLLFVFVLRYDPLFRKLESKSPELLKRYLRETKGVTSNKTLLLLFFLLTIALWFIDFLRVWLIARYYGIDLPFFLISAAVSASYILGVLSFLPGGLIVFEASLSGILTLLGTSPEAAMATTLLERVFSYWMWIGVGAVASLKIKSEAS